MYTTDEHVKASAHVASPHCPDLPCTPQTSVSPLCTSLIFSSSIFQGLTAHRAQHTQGQEALADPDQARGGTSATR